MNNIIKRITSIVFTMLFVFLLGACQSDENKPTAQQANTYKKTEAIDESEDKTTKQVAEEKPKEETKVVGSKLTENEAKTTQDEADSAQETGSQVIEINEKIFLQKINDIYFNFDDYKDSTIIIEGMFSFFESIDGKETRPVVYRNGPGCCGNDGWGGFFLIYDAAYPQENDWIRVVGKPILVQAEGGWLELFLEVETMEVKEERGSEFVSH